MSTLQLFPRIVAALVAFAFAPCIAEAATVTYTIDAQRSTLDLSGSYSGFQFQPQTTGGMSDHYDGYITGDLSSGSLFFSGGSMINAQINPNGPFQPMPGGVAGSAPGNYGVAIPSIGEFGAYRGLLFDITSGVVQDGATPSVTLAYNEGMLDYAGPATGPGQLNFAGVSGTDSASTTASLKTSGSTETLMLPFTFAISDASGLQQTFAGTLVATRTLSVPEPSTLLLGLAGGALLLGLRLRKRA